jgi:hypothetical protein
MSTSSAQQSALRSERPSGSCAEEGAVDLAGVEEAGVGVVGARLSVHVDQRDYGVQSAREHLDGAGATGVREVIGLRPADRRGHHREVGPDWLSASRDVAGGPVR